MLFNSIIPCEEKNEEKRSTSHANRESTEKKASDRVLIGLLHFLLRLSSLLLPVFLKNIKKIMIEISKYSTVWNQVYVTTRCNLSLSLSHHKNHHLLLPALFIILQLVFWRVKRRRMEIIKKSRRFIHSSIIFNSFDKAGNFFKF